MLQPSAKWQGTREWLAARSAADLTADALFREQLRRWVDAQPREVLRAIVAPSKNRSARCAFHAAQR